MLNLRENMVAAPWARWQNWADVVLGIILFISPWYTATWGNGTSSWNAWILGVVIVLVSLWALATPESPIPQWINTILGIWVFISPWVLNYTRLAGEAWSAWIIGALTIIFSAWVALQMQSPRRATVT
ncbi:hypothetical protein EPA93_40080 [Ktedonosporobacter rubrisoli]|uniref:SPW repeat-containing integral membrane domain-containing protein n=1 Tax=Ktedonosporobacter rubrisoli TaxID=2509675 RepID=A0A4P6K1H3_KTERU|nr:SPW repeat protein [Ktedonosporobacter rubrisoli]QBD81845.1 hypothetical protein EPA93_40080 [Ktedonosporobacter rubrisoli]